MCEVSDKLKLCSCGIDDKTTLKHYWIFHRFNENKNAIVIGMALLPNYIDPTMEVYNQKALLRILNTEAPFDIDLDPKNNDRLSLHFTCENEVTINYGFSYKEGRWVEETYDPVMWMWKHDKEQTGEINDAINRMK